MAAGAVDPHEATALELLAGVPFPNERMLRVVVERIAAALRAVEARSGVPVGPADDAMPGTEITGG